MNSRPTRTTLAAFTMASAASMAPTRPLVSTIPSASMDIGATLARDDTMPRDGLAGRVRLLPGLRPAGDAPARAAPRHPHHRRARPAVAPVDGELADRPRLRAV